MPKPWTLRLEPRAWQYAALDQWSAAGLSGIVDVATGAGKTTFAFMCMLRFRERHPQSQIIVIVPTIALLDQWYVALRDELGVHQSEIATGKRDDGPESASVRLVVINTARTLTPPHAESRSTMLVVDECHRAGSKVNSKALRGTFSATLGLSATPDRQYDDGFERYIVPALGPVIYAYTIADAHRDGLLSDFALVNVQTHFTPREQLEYTRLTRSVARLLRESKHSDATRERLTQTLRRRAAVTQRAMMRVPVAGAIVEEQRGSRAIVFFESISAVTRLKRLLESRRHRVAVYHSRMAPAIRRDNLSLFKKGRFDVLLCCRALDEGFNVPEASVGIIASSSASSRQRIQRLGRILRPSATKSVSYVYTVYVTDEEARRLAAEEADLEGVAVVTWSESRPRIDK